MIISNVKSMEYTITITKKERNLKYEPKRKNMYDNMSNSEPQELQFFEYPALIFDATEKQFEAIRKAALEVF